MRIAVCCLGLVLSPAASAQTAPPKRAADSREGTVVQPVVREVADNADFNGRIEPNATVHLRPRTTGLLEKVLFKDGSEVKKGDVLFQLDDRVARAEPGVAEAELIRAEARAKSADADLRRAGALNAAITREEFDRTKGAADEAKAGILAAKARVEIARFKLDDTRIVSPMNGRIGRSDVDQGNVVQQNTALATVIATDPVYVAFEMDERTFLWLHRHLREKTGTEGKLSVAVGSRDEKVFPIQAVLDFVCPTIDPRNGTVALRAVVPNPEGRLVVGQSVRVRVPTGLPQKGEPRKDKAPSEEPRLILPKRGTSAAPPTSDFPTSGPAVIVSARYPGASSEVVEETAADPIDKQLAGLEGLVGRVRVCTDDGAMQMTLKFKPGTDLSKAMVLVQNRVAVAEPTLPDVARREGVRLSKRTAHLMAVAITSPDASYDRGFLAAFAQKQLRDDIARVPGAGDATLFGADGPTPSVHLTLDREKLAALNLTVSDVTNALRDQNLTVFPTASPRALTLAASGRVAAVEDLGKITVRTTKDGQIVPLRAVAHIDQVAGWPALTAVDGKPAAILLIGRLTDANVRDTEKSLRQWLAEAAKRLPKGMELKVIGD